MDVERRHDQRAAGDEHRRLRRRVLVAVVIAAVGVAATAAWLAGDDSTGGRLSTDNTGRAAAFDLENVHAGQARVALADYRGRPVVVNFFASWCVPCRSEMPTFARVAGDFDGQVVFLGVDHQDSRGPALALLQETGVTYPTGYDPDGAVAREYGLFGMPSTVFVSADGDVVATRTGEMSETELRDALRDLFGVR